MSDRMTPEHLAKKGFVPDGKGGWRKATGLEAEQIGYTPKAAIKAYANSKTPPGLDLSKEGVIMNITLSDAEDTVSAEKVIQALAETGVLFCKTLPEHSIQLPNGEMVHVKHSFPLKPHPAPRMVRGDQWKTDPHHPDPAKRQRKPVTRYFAWRDAFRAMCAQQGYVLGDVLRVVFIMPMPKYLSRKKREMRLGQPHRQRPDTDNMIKSIKDSFRVDDGHVWDERGVKIWGEEGRIIIF